MGEAGRRDLVAVPTLPAPLQRRRERVAVHRGHTQFGQHPYRVGLARRLNHTREHELEERRVTDHVEPEPSPGPLNHLDQDPRHLPTHDRFSRITFSHPKVKLALTRVHLPSTGLQQHRKLNGRVR